MASSPPSMIEALQDDLTDKASKLVLYLKGAQIGALLRDTTTVVPAENSRLVFLPDSIYEHLVPRLTSEPQSIESISEYLASRASDKLLQELEAISPQIFDSGLAVMPHPMSSDAGPCLAVRLTDVGGASLLTDQRSAILEKTLRDSIEQCGWFGFLDVHRFSEQFSKLVNVLLGEDVSAGFPSVEVLYEWHAQNLSSSDEIASAEEDLDSHARRLKKALEDQNLSSSAMLLSLDGSVAHAAGWLEERRAELDEAEEWRADADEDEWRERRHEERHELENGPYADVDE